jgi:uncharacterized membrane protein
MLKVRRLVTATFVGAALAACSGGDDGGPTQTPAISIALSSSTLSVTAGQTGTVTVNLTRSGGFTGDVAVAVEGLPAGVTFTATPASLGSAVTSTVITITVPANAAAGTSNLTVRATGSGVTAQTAALALTIVAAPAPNYTLAVSPATATVAAGGNTTVTVNITRTNFTGGITLAATGLPAGVTAAFNPTGANTGNTATLTLTAAANAAANAGATVTVTGTATGITDKTATFQLAVTAAPANGFTLSLNPTSLSIAQGANGTSTVTIARTGTFTGAVDLTASGLPNGVTAAFAPASATGNTSTLTLTASATAATGAATVTIKGTGTGVTDQTVTLALTVTAPAGGYTLDVTETSVPITAGATATANITLARTGGFTGAVALTAENLPTGVTASFNPQSVTGNSSVLTLTAAANAPAASATVLVRGTSAGQQDKSDTFLLTVSAAGGFTLSLNPTSLSVQQGANGNTTVTITRTGGFTGTVNLSATGLPNGVTASFNPAAATGNTSTLTLTASATATTGAATVAVKGQATGQTDQTVNLSLNVTTSVGGSGNTTWEFCTVGLTPIWFAVQDGANGTWTRVNPTGTKFQFNITQPKAGIAYVVNNSAASVASASRTLAGKLSNQLQQQLLLRNRPPRVNAYVASSAVESFTLNILYGTQTELNGVGTTRCQAGSGKTVNGTVAGLSASGLSSQSAIVSLGPSSASASAAQPAFSLKNVPDGNLDLIAGRTTTAFSGTDFSITLDKLIIRRGINAANNSTLPVLDFGSSEAFDPVQADLTIANLGTDIAYATTSYYTGGGTGTTGAALSTFSTPNAGPFKYLGVPAAKQAAGDLHLILAFALPSLTQTDQTRFAGLYFKDPVARTVTLGPVLTAPTVSVVATAPYVRFRATGPVQTQYNQALSFSFSQSNTTVARSVLISASQGYLAGLTTYDFQVPDFTAVAGWDNNWGPKTGIQTQWGVSAFAFIGGFGPVGNPVEGSGYQAASRNGTITP